MGIVHYGIVYARGDWATQSNIILDTVFYISHFFRMQAFFLMSGFFDWYWPDQTYCVRLHCERLYRLCDGLLFQF